MIWMRGGCKEESMRGVETKWKVDNREIDNAEMYLVKFSSVAVMCLIHSLECIFVGLRVSHTPPADQSLDDFLVLPQHFLRQRFCWQFDEPAVVISMRILKQQRNPFREHWLQN